MFEFKNKRLFTRGYGLLFAKHRLLLCGQLSVFVVVLRSLAFTQKFNAIFLTKQRVLGYKSHGYRTIGRVIFLMYIRFVVDIKDRRSGRRKGVFAGMGVLKKRDLMLRDEMDWYQRMADWFNKHLPEPGRFSRSSKSRAQPVALSWFKDTSTEYISNARKVAVLLEKYGFSVVMLTTHRPGYIVYEDEFQIVAVPYADTPT